MKRGDLQRRVGLVVVRDPQCADREHDDEQRDNDGRAEAPATVFAVLLTLRPMSHWSFGLTGDATRRAP